MLSKAHWTSDSRCLALGKWLDHCGFLVHEALKDSSSVYSCHLFLISSASVKSLPFLSFIVPIFAWFWEWLKAGGEGTDRGRDSWMASLTRWTWVWLSSRSWWWKGKPGVLQSMGLKSQIQLCDWTKLNLHEMFPWYYYFFFKEISSFSHSIIFLYFFALIAEEGFLISPCYFLVLCIQMGISFLFYFAFGFSFFLSYF